MIIDGLNMFKFNILLACTKHIEDIIRSSRWFGCTVLKDHCPELSGGNN